MVSWLQVETTYEPEDAPVQDTKATVISLCKQSVKIFNPQQGLVHQRGRHVIPQILPSATR